MPAFSRGKAKSRLLKWLAICSFFSFLLPNHYSPWSSAHQEWLMAVGVLPLAMWAVWQGNARLPLLSVASLLLALVPLVQFATGQIYFFGDALMSTLYLAGFGFAVLAGSRLARDADGPAKLKAMSVLWLALVLASIVSMGIAIHQWLDLRLLGVFIIDLPPQARVFANLAQPNQFATLLLLGLTGLIFLFEAQLLGATVAMCAAFILAFGLAMTASRSVLLGSCWLIAIYFVARRRCRLRLTSTAVVSVLAFYIAVNLAWPWMNRVLLLDDGARETLNRFGPGVRMIYLRSMLEAISLSPWTGYGWGQISVAQHATALAYPPTYNFFESSHNLVLDLLLWNGVPVGLMAVTLLVSWFVVQYRHLGDRLAWASLLGIGFVFCHAMVEFPLNYAYFLLPVGFLMGMLGQPRSWLEVPVWSPHPNLLRYSMAVAAATVTGVFVAVSAEYPKFEADWREMRFAEQRIGDHASYVPPKALLLTQLGELLRFTRTEAAPGLSAAELEWMRRVSTRFSYSSSLYRYALAQGLNGQADGAVQTLRILCSVHPAATCASARSDWALLGKEKWPVLSGIRFP